MQRRRSRGPRQRLLVNDDASDHVGHTRWSRTSRSFSRPARLPRGLRVGGSGRSSGSGREWAFTKGAIRPASLSGCIPGQPRFRPEGCARVLPSPIGGHRRRKTRHQQYSRRLGSLATCPLVPLPRCPDGPLGSCAPTMECSSWSSLQVPAASVKSRRHSGSRMLTHQQRSVVAGPNCAR
jgi:hypothetical protein